jgi:pimeloyl-ACP methyl ester carboxylesterase
LIIEGKNDTILPELYSKEMYNKIKGSEINFIPDGKHCVNVQNPDDVDKYILRFLEKL